jgi:hypothetical protein
MQTNGSRFLREFPPKAGDFFTGRRPVRIACVTVEDQRAGLQRFFEFFPTERNCLVVVVRTVNIELQSVAHDPSCRFEICRVFACAMQCSGNAPIRSRSSSLGQLLMVAQRVPIRPLAYFLRGPHRRANRLLPDAEGQCAMRVDPHLATVPGTHLLAAAVWGGQVGRGRLLVRRPEPALQKLTRTPLILRVRG